MYRHYREHNDWNNEHVESIEADCEVVEAESKDDLGQVCADYRGIIRQGLADVDRQLPSDVEYQVVSSVCFDDCDDAEDDAGDPENLISELVSTSEILIEHVHDREENHRVRRLIVDVSNQKSPVYLVVDLRNAVEGRVAGWCGHIGGVGCCGWAVPEDRLEMEEQ